MEGAPRHASRLLRSQGAGLLLQQRRLPRSIPGAGVLPQKQQRTLSNSPASLAPDSMFTSFAAGSPQPGPPPSFFTHRTYLPANTVVRFVPQQTAWIVERMGKFNRILEPGLAILVPFLDRIAYVKSLKETAFEIPSQNAITADNVTLDLDAVLYTRVHDAYKAR